MRRDSCHTCSPVLRSFNSRTHAGCDNSTFLYLDTFQQVSIHAPTRGADVFVSFIFFTVYVSIHAPTRGATTFFELESVSARFQFTHPRGVRQKGNNSVTPGFVFQFTHPRGVRPRIGTARTINHKPFQFTHPRGVRPNNKRTRNLALEFQFTHPRGVRPLIL